ncbi:class I SAM-dependent methyltransferase [Methylobacterium sp. WSM2598]|uniref:class I SAM-dependent methyltransferase n=1 Tax=Methylobacterium sp. WSM2598 TaxID=398261 RepID=UPI00036090AC|nr:class I SAM-dependent methyltransferase [Methylobacterium sp. WSM2598]
MFKTGRSATVPGGFGGVLYLDFLAALAAKRQTRHYLEIGVHFGHTLARIPCDTAVGVDPHYRLDRNVTAGKRRTFLFQMTSDRFFAETDLRALLGGGVDMAFLDGLHQFEFLLRDIAHAEAASAPNGLILLHDCMPLNAEMTTRDAEAEREDAHKAMWTGDVWKVVPILRRYRPDLEVICVDCPPTGLVCLTNLDPTSRVLRDNERAIVREYRDLASTQEQLTAFYAENPIVRSVDILNGHDHSLYFRV